MDREERAIRDIRSQNTRYFQIDIDLDYGDEAKSIFVEADGIDGTDSEEILDQLDFPDIERDSIDLLTEITHTEMERIPKEERYYIIRKK